MISKLTMIGEPNRSSKKTLAVIMMIAASCLIPAIAGQTTPRNSGPAERNCGGLHAGIRAVLVRRGPPDTQPPFVMLNFVLLNDGDTIVNSTAEGWKIVIDGKELSDSDWIFGNGPMPTGGYGNLNPGDSYELGKGLEISKYFPEERLYQVSWKGKGFQSSTIPIRITPRR